LIVPMHAIKDGKCSCPKGDACERAGKHPITQHGVNDATTERDQIRRWWTDNPNANIGIATGRKSGIIVLDIDPRNGGVKSLKRQKRRLGPLPDTVTALTGGGGRHLIFKCPSFAVKKDTSGKRFGKGVDILSDGCIMVAPPSRHATGGRYRWAEDWSDRDLEPATLPKSWRARLRKDVSAESNKDNSTAQPDGRILEGQRNTSLTSLAGTLQRGGVSPAAIKAALIAENNAKCTPPLDESEIKKIVASITKYPAPAPIGDGADDAERLMQLVLERSFSRGKHLMLGTDGRFWHYDVRLWRPVSDQWVSKMILETIQANPVKKQNTAPLMGQVLTVLKAKVAVKDDVLGFVADPPPVINCANGELWIAEDGSVDLRRHRPESHLRHCLDVPYDPDAKCPEYDRAVGEIFASADEPEDLVRHWNEFVGYVIQPRRHIPTIMILLGTGDNGKTVLIRTIIRLLGKSLVEAQRVDNLDKNRFAMGSLFGKLLYVDDDVRAGARLPDGILKTISEAKEVTGEYKYKSPFNFTVRTVPVLLCNNIPSLADLSHGMLRRLQVIPFDRTFTGDDKDADLFERIWANELPGVLNRALRGYQRLLERNSSFKIPAAVNRATAAWLAHANPLPAFIEECCVKGVRERCWMKSLYAAYTTWAQRAGYTMIQSQQSVHRNLEHLGFKCSRGNRGQRVNGLALRQWQPQSLSGPFARGENV
jgi:P4 family phage/plasmid primase-like protien